MLFPKYLKVFARLTDARSGLTVYLVGAKDWNRRIFDALIPLPQGTSYNAYLVKGKEKTALIDTVNPEFEEELAGKISQVIGLTDLDYVVMNHAEPDHAGAIPHIMKLTEAELVTTEKGAKMAQVYYGVQEERIKAVKDGDIIELGNKILKFIEAPFLHWPETMFTYLVENKVLFPCDFFGTHTAFGLYDDDVEELIPFAKRYFGKIMMPFRNMGKRALFVCLVLLNCVYCKSIDEYNAHKEKIKDIEIKIIAPSHGAIYKKPEGILEAYRKWTVGETEKKVIVVYVSMFARLTDARSGLTVELYHKTLRRW